MCTRGSRLAIGLCFLGLVLTSVTRAQSYFPTSQPPLVTSAGFLEWSRHYVDSCVREAPLDRTTTVFFAPNGDDVSGDGSIASPYRSISKANAVIQASVGNLRIRFHSGSVFRSTYGLVVSKPSVTVDSYRTSNDPYSLPKPRLTRFEPEVPNSQWLPTAWPGVYQVNVNDPVAWIKFSGDERTVFRRMVTLEDCQSTQGTWFWAGGILTVHSFSDLSLRDTDRRIEYVLKNQECGIWVKDVPNVRLHDLQIEGFGAGTPGDHSYPGYGIRSDAAGSNRLVVTECETYYNGRHSMCKVGDVVGGSLVLVRCKMGWLVNDGINAVSFSAFGGQELVTCDCEYLGCELPSTNNPYPYAAGSSPVYLHTSNDAIYRQGFLLAIRDVIVPGQYQCGDIPTTTCAPDVTTLDSCRSFVIGLDAPARSRTAFDDTKPSSSGGNGLLYKALGSHNTIYLNSTVKPTVLWTQATGDVSLCTSASGLWINSDITFDFSQSQISPWNRVLSISATSPAFANFDSSFTGCHIRFLCSGGGSVIGFSGPMIHRFGSYYGDIAARWLGTMNASIVDVRGIGTGSFLLGFGNGSAWINSNAYYGLSSESGAWGCDQDLDRVKGTDVDGAPMFGSELLMSSPIKVLGQVLMFDKTGRLRAKHPTIGPIEGIGASLDVKGLGG